MEGGNLCQDIGQRVNNKDIWKNKILQGEETEYQGLREQQGISMGREVLAKGEF